MIVPEVLPGVPTGAIFAVLLILLALVRRLGSPIAQTRSSHRLLALTLGAMLNIILTTLIVTTLYSALLPFKNDFIDATEQLAPIAWARAQLSGLSVGSLVVAMVLLAIALGGIAAQYLVRWPLARRNLWRSADTLPKATGRAERMIAGFNAVVTAGIGEEWIFRVLLPIEFYAATQSIAVGALVPLVIFAAFHYDQNWRGVGNAAVFGLAATIVYVVSTNVWLVIAMHSIANLIAVVVVPEFQLQRIRAVARRAIAPIDNDSGVTLAAQQSHPLP